MPTVKRDMRSLRALKDEGHNIIDDLVRKGWSKNRVYAMLAERLGKAETGAHFYNIHTTREAQKAVDTLERLREDLLLDRKRKRAERHRLALELKARHAATLPAPKLTWLQRVLAYVGL